MFGTHRHSTLILIMMFTEFEYFKNQHRKNTVLRAYNIHDLRQKTRNILNVHFKQFLICFPKYRQLTDLFESW